MQNPDIDQLYKAQLDLLTAAYSQAKAYFNLVIVGGYAAYFGLWTLTTEVLTSAEKLWSALLISISVFAFVAWEIYQMVFSNMSLLRIADAVQDRATFLQKISQHNEEMARRSHAMGKLWAAALVITIGFAVAGAGVLLAAFVQGIWRQYA